MRISLQRITTYILKVHPVPKTSSRQWDNARMWGKAVPASKGADKCEPYTWSRELGPVMLVPSVAPHSPLCPGILPYSTENKPSSFFWSIAERQMA